jgi:2-haloacid dehalogenase
MANEPATQLLARDRVRLLTFDVGGTVFDWHSTIRDDVRGIAAAKGARVDAAAFANAWRRGMFEHLAEVRSGQLPWMNADHLHRMALDDVLRREPELRLSNAERDELNRVWHRLRAWPDAPAAIARLRGRFTVIVLTVLSWAIVVDSSKAAGIDWDGVLACEFLGHYKPAREAYLAGVRLAGGTPEQAMMVAAHPGDLRAAMAAGLHAAYVPRPGEQGAGNDGDLSPQPDFAVNAADFADLARQLVGESHRQP